MQILWRRRCSRVVDLKLPIKISRQKRRCRSRPPRQSDVRDDKNVCCLSSLFRIYERETSRLESRHFEFRVCLRKGEGPQVGGVARITLVEK